MNYNLDQLIYPLISGSRPKGGVSLVGEIPSYGGENISKESQVIHKNVKRIDMKYFSSMKKGHLKLNDILINKDGANTGKLAIYNIAPYKLASVNEHIFILRAKEKIIDQLFLFYLLQTKKNIHNIYLSISGSAQPGLNTKFTKNIPIYLPTIENQRKISTIIESLTNFINDIRKKIIKSSNIKKSLYRDLFTSGINNKVMVHSSIGIIPKDWHITKMSHKDSQITLLDGDRGKNYPKNYEIHETGYCLFLSAKNISKKGFQLEKSQFINIEKDQKLGSGKLIRDDLIITTRGSVGNIVHYNNKVSYDQVRINSGMAIIRNNNKKINTNFLFHLMKSEIINKQIRKETFGSAQPQLTMEIIGNFKIVIPKLEEQLEINNMLDSVNDNIFKLENKLKKFQSMKESILEELIISKSKE